jgi:hypothetical protein
MDAPLGGLGRQGAVRKRKGEVHEMNGHKFLQRQFYQLMLCAFCNDFLLNALGYQCEDCRYTCHKKCYEKVVTKCISKSNTGVSVFCVLHSHLVYLPQQEGDEEKINHRIPHRFEPLTNIGANWCCHCGYMLPLGRKNARKCSECDITCHANCAHLVPDFCGMSMETANQLLRDWRDINKARGGKAGVLSRPPGPSHPAGRYTHSPSPSLDGQLGGAMGRLAVTGGPEPALPVVDAYGRRQQTQSPTQDKLAPDPRYQQQAPYVPQQPPLGARPPPGARIPIPPGYPQEHVKPGRPPPGAYDPAAQDGYTPVGYPVTDLFTASELNH